MTDFIERLQTLAALHPDRTAVVDRDGMRHTTYRQLYENAMKVNAWLKAKDIGREDVVAIYFKKGMEYIAVRIGIIMAGAAWVALEDFMGKERIDFIVADCDSKVVFDMEKWNEAMLLAPCKDMADPDDHDLAFFIYTSGSTGNPKGAAQEYGIYRYIKWGADGFSYRYSYSDGDEKKPTHVRLAHVIPESFVGGVYITIGCLSNQMEVHVISMELTRNPEELIKYFLSHQMGLVFMTPTFFHAAQKIPGLALKAGYIGGEIVSGIYSDDFDIWNIYGPSEFGHPTCVFLLDRAYDNTPVGETGGYDEIVLLDEEDKESDRGGELCIRLPFFRGYHNLPKENESSFVELAGKRFFRSRDYAERDEKGRYSILGRVDAMVKINGNRIEPQEVENAIKKAFDVDFCVVKPVQTGGRTSLCAYYIGEGLLREKDVAKVLAAYLADYMIPTYYVPIEEIPLNDNNKVDKKRLPEPKIEDYLHIYEPPRNAMEEKLCTAFSEVLKRPEKTGIDDDFFLMGGDSLLAMGCIVNVGIEKLTVKMIFEGRTVRKIAGLLSEVSKDDDIRTTEPAIAPLNCAQRYLLSYDAKFPNTTMLNISAKFVLRQDADIFLYKDISEQVITSHPALCSVIEKRGDTYYQKYDPKMEPKLVVEDVGEEEIAGIEADFVKPFDPMTGPLYRCRILHSPRTKEILLDVYHVVCDGFSFERLIEDVGRALDGEKLHKDHCFSILANEAKQNTDADRAYFEAHYGEKGYATLPFASAHSSGDKNNTKNADGNYIIAFSHKKEKADRLSRQYYLGKNGLYIVAVALALAEYNRTDKVMFTWTWNGRGDSQKENAVGCFFMDLPVAFTFESDMTVSEVLTDTARQIREAIAHGSVSYFMEKGGYYGSDLLCLMYQQDIYDYSGEDLVVEADALVSERTGSSNALDVEIIDSEKEYGIFFDYNAGMYDAPDIERFASRTRDIAGRLVEENPLTTKLHQLVSVWTDN